MAGSTAPTVPPGKEEGKQDDGMATSKKYTLVFLTAVGTTLLLTGATGGRLLKRAQQTSKAATTEPVASSSKLPPPRPSILPVRPPPAREAPAGLPSFPSLAKLSNRRKSKSYLSLLSQQHGSDLSFWLSNPALTRYSMEAAERGRIADAAWEGDPDHGRLSDEPLTFNPALDALKALGIATAITFGLFGAGGYALMRKYDVDTPQDLALVLTHSVPPLITSLDLPSWIPAWARPEARTDADDEADADSPMAEAVREGTSYMRELQREMDEEAEFARKEKRQRWAEIKRRMEDQPVKR